jgi:hypothetical protein
MNVELTEGRQERVRIAERERRAARILDLELVGERQILVREERLPQARGILEFRLDALRLHTDVLRLGAVRTHDDAAVGLVRAEDRVRICAELDHVSRLPNRPHSKPTAYPAK